jgi:hypothetical protein
MSKATLAFGSSQFQNTFSDIFHDSRSDQSNSYKTNEVFPTSESSNSVISELAKFVAEMIEINNSIDTTTKKDPMNSKAKLNDSAVGLNPHDADNNKNRIKKVLTTEDISLNPAGMFILTALISCCEQHEDSIGHKNPDFDKDLSTTVNSAKNQTFAQRFFNPPTIQLDMSPLSPIIIHKDWILDPQVSLSGAFALLEAQFTVYLKETHVKRILCYFPYFYSLLSPERKPDTDRQTSDLFSLGEISIFHPYSELQLPIHPHENNQLSQNMQPFSSRTISRIFAQIVQLTQNSKIPVWMMNLHGCGDLNDADFGLGLVDVGGYRSDLVPWRIYVDQSDVLPVNTISSTGYSPGSSLRGTEQGSKKNTDDADDEKQRIAAHKLAIQTQFRLIKGLSHVEQRMLLKDAYSLFANFSSSPPNSKTSGLGTPPLTASVHSKILSPVKLTCIAQGVYNRGAILQFKNHTIWDKFHDVNAQIIELLWERVVIKLFAREYFFIHFKKFGEDKFSQLGKKETKDVFKNEISEKRFQHGHDLSVEIPAKPHENLSFHDFVPRQVDEYESILEDPFADDF